MPEEKQWCITTKNSWDKSGRMKINDRQDFSSRSRVHTMHEMHASHTTKLTSWQSRQWWEVLFLRTRTRSIIIILSQRWGNLIMLFRWIMDPGWCGKIKCRMIHCSMKHMKRRPRKTICNKSVVKSLIRIETNCNKTWFNFNVQDMEAIMVVA